jgi:hypothetical protein
MNLKCDGRKEGRKEGIRMQETEMINNNEIRERGTYEKAKTRRRNKMIVRIKK